MKNILWRCVLNEDWHGDLRETWELVFNDGFACSETIAKEIHSARKPQHHSYMDWLGDGASQLVEGVI